MAVYHTCRNFWGPLARPAGYLKDLLDALDALRIKAGAGPTDTGWLVGKLAFQGDHAALVALHEFLRHALGRQSATLPPDGYQEGAIKLDGSSTATAAVALLAGLQRDLALSPQHQRRLQKGLPWMVTPAQPTTQEAALDLLISHLGSALTDVGPMPEPHPSETQPCKAREVLALGCGSEHGDTATWAGAGSILPGAWRDRTRAGDFMSILDDLLPPGKRPQRRSPVIETVTPVWDDTEEAENTQGDNKAIPAGFTYLGQFITHDLTFSVRSTAWSQGVENLSNLRTASLDLDSVYGTGPDAAPFLYEANRSDGQSRVGRLRWVSRDLPLGFEAGRRVQFDLARDDQGIALIADPRNDENLIVSQLHVLFLRLHGAVLDDLERLGIGKDQRERFLLARSTVIRAYRDVVLYDFVRRMLGRHQFDGLLAGRLGNSRYREKLQTRLRQRRALPTEFVSAALRVGHSMIRSGYSLNDVIQRVPVFHVPADPACGMQLLGFRRLPEHWTVDWNLFFEVADDVTPQFARRIGTRLSPLLRSLPAPVSPNGGALADLDLKRGVEVRLPSGHEAARRIGVPPVGSDAPLWFYLLAEAEMGGGEYVGPLGAVLLGEPIRCLLDADGYFDSRQAKVNPRILGSGTESPPSMADLIRYVQSAPDTRRSMLRT